MELEARRIPRRARKRNCKRKRTRKRICKRKRKHPRLLVALRIPLQNGASRLFAHLRLRKQEPNGSPMGGNGTNRLCDFC